MVPSPAASGTCELDAQCQQKLQELAAAYMEPLKRSIQMKEASIGASEGRIGSGGDDQKDQKELKKMRSLLDILSNKIPPKVVVNLLLLEVSGRRFGVWKGMENVYFKN